MTILQIEHAVQDFDTWKRAFDEDPAHREAGGVRRYEIYRPVDDEHYIAVDLEFDDRSKAEAFKSGLEALWRSPQAARTLEGVPTARIVETVESRRY